MCGARVRGSRRLQPRGGMMTALQSPPSGPVPGDQGGDGRQLSSSAAVSTRTLPAECKLILSTGTRIDCRSKSPA